MDNKIKTDFDESNILKGLRLLSDPKCIFLFVITLKVNNFTQEQKLDYLKQKISEAEFNEVLKRAKIIEDSENKVKIKTKLQKLLMYFLIILFQRILTKSAFFATCGFAIYKGISYISTKINEKHQLLYSKLTEESKNTAKISETQIIPEPMKNETKPQLTFKLKSSKTQSAPEELKSSENYPTELIKYMEKYENDLNKQNCAAQMLIRLNMILNSFGSENPIKTINISNQDFKNHVLNNENYNEMLKSIGFSKEEKSVIYEYTESSPEKLKIAISFFNKFINNSD